MAIHNKINVTQYPFQNSTSALTNERVGQKENNWRHEVYTGHWIFIDMKKDGKEQICELRQQQEGPGGQLGQVHL